MKRRSKQIMALFLACILCISNTGCSTKNVKTTTQKITKKIQTNKKEVQSDFDSFLQDLFVKEVQSDSITLNYTLKDPAKYGITNFTPTLGEYGVEATKKSLAEAENVNAILEETDYDSLTQEQQITYDILQDYYSINGNEKKYFYYGEALGNTTGMQAQLPILLSEYHINNQADLDTYLELLTVVDDYFSQIESYEEEKSKAGLFMSDSNANNIIKQCKDFIKKPEKNLLISVFQERVEDFDWLDKKEKSTYIEKNKKAVLENVIPAYEHLISTLTKLKGTGKNEGGIGNLPNGKEYYEETAQSTTGSDMTIKQMKNSMYSAINTASLTLQSANTKYTKKHSDADIFQDYFSIKYPETEPEKIVSYLEEKSKTDFPSLEPVDFHVKYVDESLKDHVSPAFYLTPPLDDYKNNSIYINDGKSDSSALFSTLAHEGYPGHLLQTVYFQQQNPSPIRALISYGGYSEGWATYCEQLSYYMADIDENLADFAFAYNTYILCLYGLMDIGVNYDCWTKEELVSFLKDYGIDDKEVAENAYNIVVDDPGNYLQYVVGYLSFIDLRNTAKKELRKKYDQKEFHTFLLDMGPAPFSVIKKYLKKWIKDKK